MKKTVIGIALLISGILIDLCLTFTAMLHLPHLMAWSTSYPSKLCFLIFAGKSNFSDGADGLALGSFFIFGIVLMLLGLIVLAVEYFRKEK